MVLCSIGPDMLVMWDRGFHSFGMYDHCSRQKVAFLGARLVACTLHTHLLSAGLCFYLAYIRHSEYKRCQAGEVLLVRAIEYTIHDPARIDTGCIIVW